MRSNRGRPTGAIMMAVLMAGSARAADASSVGIGHADFVPTPEHPIGFRGDGQGCYPGATPPIEWWDGTPVKREIALEGKPTLMRDTADTKSKNILWKVPAPGWGYAHPIVVGKRIYTVGHPYWVACYDAETGKELWKRAMTPMLAAGMKAEKAEALRKVCDLASAFFMLNHQQKQGDAVFLFQKPSKEEAKDPAGVVKTEIETGTKALAMITKSRADVEAVGDQELVKALDKDVAAIELMMDMVPWRRARSSRTTWTATCSGRIKRAAVRSGITTTSTVRRWSVRDWSCNVRKDTLCRPVGAGTTPRPARSGGRCPSARARGTTPHLSFWICRLPTAWWCRCW